MPGSNPPPDVAALVERLEAWSSNQLAIVSTKRAKEVAALCAAWRALAQACQDAIEHTEEFEDAWRRGAIEECDGKGGTRSNRNADVNRKLRKALKEPPHA